MGVLRRTFGSLDSRNYRLFFFGDLISYIGSWMQTMAEAWVVWSLTKSGAAVGRAVGAASRARRAALRLVAHGHPPDDHPRRSGGHARLQFSDVPDPDG